MSDRELDAQVAGRVFGWHVIGGVGIAPGGIGAEKIRPYSSTWEGAGLVIEEMQRRGWWWDINTAPDAVLAMASRRDETPPVVVTATTVPEAVARAALVALGTPVEEAT